LKVLIGECRNAHGGQARHDTVNIQVIMRKIY
jgi:hypothetical protein